MPLFGLVLVVAGLAALFLTNPGSSATAGVWKNWPPDRRGLGNQPNLWLIPMGARFRVAATDTPDNKSSLQLLANQPGISGNFLGPGVPWPDNGIKDDNWPVAAGYIRFDGQATSADVSLSGLYAVWIYVAKSA